MNRKKHWILIVCCILAVLFPKIGMPNHLLGAEIRFKNISNDSLEVVFTAYRLCTDNVSTITIYPPTLTLDSCGSTDTLKYFNLISFKIEDITPVCATQQKPCQMSGGNGVSTPQIPMGAERHTYVYHFYKGGISSNCCWIKASWNQAYRSSIITTGHASGTLVLEAWYNRCTNNSSPKFNSDPLILKFVGQDVFYNIGAKDSDQDSLSYFMAEPHDGSYSIPWSPNYPLTCYGGNFPNPLSSPPTGFYLNAITGEIIFRPIQVQVTVIKIGVKEWRKINGVYTLVGVTFRDITFSVFNPNGNISPVITTPLTYEVCAGKQICFQIGTNDANSNDSTFLLIDSASQILNSSFNIITSTTPRFQKGEFCWTTDSALIRSQAYTFNMKLRDDHCPVYGANIYTFNIIVTEPPEITTNIRRLTCYDYQAIGMLTRPVYNQVSQWQVFYQGKLKSTYNNLDTIRYTMDSTGTYIFKYMVSNSGCLFTHYDTVFYSLPSPLLIKSSNDTIVCRNTNITLSTIAINGKSPYHYQWYANGVLLDTTSSITRIVITSQQFQVRVISSDSCHSVAYDSVMIIADTSRLVMKTLNDTAICEGAITQIIPILLRGTLPMQYSWYENNNLISTKDTLMIIPTKASRYILKSVSSDACYNTVYDTVDVNFLPKTLKVQTTRDTTICSNSPYTFKAILSGGNTYNYSWCPVGKSCSTLPNPVYTFDTTTKVYLEITSNAICTEVYRDTITIHVFPKSPITLTTKNLTINKNQSTVIKAGNGSGFVWSGNSIKQNWGDSIEVNPTITSTYKVIGNNINGCTDSAQITITVTYVGIDNQNKISSTLNIHPNPAKDVITVNGYQNQRQYEIDNILGLQVLHGELNSNSTLIDIHSLPAGIYFIKIGNEVKQWIKE